MIRNNVVNRLIERNRLMKMNKNERNHRIGRRTRGFTLVEVLIASVIVAIIGIGIISTVLVARQIAEYDKQRIAAISNARRYLEERTRRDLFPTLSPVSDVILDNFNTPETSDDLMATVDLHIYNVNPDGSRGTELTSPPTTDHRVEVEVVISWNRTGSLSSIRVSESISTYVTPDV